MAQVVGERRKPSSISSITTLLIVMNAYENGTEAAAGAGAGARHEEIDARHDEFDSRHGE